MPIITESDIAQETRIAVRQSCRISADPDERQDFLLAWCAAVADPRKGLPQTMPERWGRLRDARRVVMRARRARAGFTIRGGEFERLPPYVDCLEVGPIVPVVSPLRLACDDADRRSLGHGGASLVAWSVARGRSCQSSAGPASAAPLLSSGSDSLERVACLLSTDRPRMPGEIDWSCLWCSYIGDARRPSLAWASYGERDDLAD